MLRPSPHSIHNPSFLSPATSGNASTFTLVPELISANATHLDALSQQANSSDLGIGALTPLVDVPFVGPFCQAAATALQRQREHVTELNAYGASAARALTDLVYAVSSAEDASTHALQAISPKPGASVDRGTGGV